MKRCAKAVTSNTFFGIKTMFHLAAKIGTWTLLALLLIGRANGQQDPWTPDKGLQDGAAILAQHPDAYRALPGVFIVNSVASGTLNCPTNIECDQQSLDELYDRAVTSGDVPVGWTETMFKWALLASQPDKFLHVSAEMQTIELRDAVLGHGTAYAISREGILLTNRHVVEHDVIMPFGFDVEPVGFRQMLLNGVEKLGAFDGDSMAASLVGEELENWYARKCDRSRVTTRLVISAAYQEKAIGTQADAGAIAVQLALKSFDHDTRKPILIPVEVVATGKMDPKNELVNDIAVLRVQGNVTDSLVCLPLAHDSEVTAGAPIYSLGFPGYKYDLASGQLAGLYKVNVESGSISAPPGASFASRIRSQGLVSLRCKLRQGCSGGPVVLANGRVAAMNVAHVQSELFRQFITRPETPGLAVSLLEIRKMLAAQGITPDVGPTTLLWNEAFNDYLRGDRASAAAKLHRVAAAQTFRSSNVLSQPIVNQYVGELLEICKKPE
jgi:S1-C subfamily serine protease